MHHRRARPTLRVLREDLGSGWDSPYPLRMLAAGDPSALHPLSELCHPIIRKAAESIGVNPADDLVEGRIQSVQSSLLLEIRHGQWRGAIWLDDETGVNWLVAAGLAKGGHEDHEDFYKKAARAEAAGAVQAWLPVAEDRRLLKQETAARLLTQWELKVQQQICAALQQTSAGGTADVRVEHPRGDGQFLATVSLQIAPVRDADYEADEIVVEIQSDSAARGGALEWRLTLRTLISLCPPEQGWDRFGNSYSNIGVPGAWSARADELSALVEAGTLAQSEPGAHAHYTHKAHIAGSTIDGTGLRGLCGVFFVPRQDHTAKPECPACAEVLARIPA